MFDLDTHKKMKFIWYEIGHFIAAHYNHELYKSTPTEAIMVQRYGDELRTTYFPYKHHYDENKDYQEGAAALIAYQCYGSIVVAIQHDQPIHHYFNAQGEKAMRDYGAFLDFTGDNGITHYQINGLFQCLHQYTEHIRDNVEWKPLFDTDLSDLLQEPKHQFPIDLEKMRERLTPFLQQHAPSYKRFITALKQAVAIALAPRLAKGKGMR